MGTAVKRPLWIRYSLLSGPLLLTTNVWRGSTCGEDRVQFGRCVSRLLEKATKTRGHSFKRSSNLLQRWTVLESEQSGPALLQELSKDGWIKGSSSPADARFAVKLS